MNDRHRRSWSKTQAAATAAACTMRKYFVCVLAENLLAAFNWNHMNLICEIYTYSCILWSIRSIFFCARANATKTKATTTTIIFIFAGVGFCVRRNDFVCFFCSCCAVLRSAAHYSPYNYKSHNSTVRSKYERAVDLPLLLLFSVLLETIIFTINWACLIHLQIAFIHYWFITIQLEIFKCMR